jgi:acyl-CoA dehydrogenase
MPPTGAIWPQVFSSALTPAPDYSSDPAVQKLIEFFGRKGLRALKEEDRREQWYQDWLDYQAHHRLYASVLSPKEFSSLGFQLDLLKLARLLEVFGYFSAAHGYSLQCTFLGLFPILMGSNERLKRDAVAALESGAALALGVSEKEHGADLLGNAFSVTRVGEDQFVANGSKYYIGNANCASLISILAREHEPNSSRNSRRARFVLFVLRRQGVENLRKIPTLGVRSAFVGEFNVRDYEFSQTDIIAEGRDAWDAVIGTVTLGKFFLGFGSIGICEHAFAEAMAHLSTRILYGKPVIELPHIRLAMAQAYARLTAMKLFAYRALDYGHAASVDDRRYLLFTAVQKARVSTEGVKVMSLISECVGARGFESDTYIEMALRDVPLIPSLEGSAHINLALAAQFIPQYFDDSDPNRPEPQSLIEVKAARGENTYLMHARSGKIRDIAFGDFRKPFESLSHIANVQIFVDQTRAFQRFASPLRESGAPTGDQSIALAMGQCIAVIAYAQLVAENALLMAIPPQMIAVMFHLLVQDLAASLLALSSLPGVNLATAHVTLTPRTSPADWDFVFARLTDYGDARSRG